MDPRTAKGFALLLTYGRAATNLPRFFHAAKATGMVIPGYVVVDRADYAAHKADYDAVDLPSNWSIHLVKGGCCAAATEEARRALFKEDTDYVFWLADDLIPETPEWDVKCIEALTRWNCVSTNDGKFAPKKFNGATVWSGDLLRAIGYFYAPGLRHFFIDTIIEELDALMNIRVTLMDVMVRHAHISFGGYGDPDETLVRTNSFWKEDEPAMMSWRRDDRVPAANRIGKLLVKAGVSEPLPDLTGISVMIGVPCGDGRYERLFMQSLWSTIEGLRQCGAQVNFAELPYCSDICLARTKIFGMFMRSDATHLFFIDSDMSWRPSDAIKLFSYKRDFVAVAGPRKIFPVSFAVRAETRDGRPMPITQEAGGLFTVSHVGMAFALMTKDCATRVAQAHPDLDFGGDDGRIEHAVFIPMVVNGRYFSEDFAFCQRWRDCGGKLYVDPAISLKHVGAFVWEGSWMQTLLNEKSQAA